MRKLILALAMLALVGCEDTPTDPQERMLWVTEVPDDLPEGFWVSDTGTGRTWPWNGPVGPLCVGYTDDPPPIYSIHYWTYDEPYPRVMGRRVDPEPVAVPVDVADCTWPYNL